MALAFVMLFIIVLFYLIITLLKYTKMPPGPYGLPIIGYYPFMLKSPYDVIMRLSKKYDDVMTINLFGKTIWVLNSYEAIKEALVSNGENFAERSNVGYNLVQLIGSFRLTKGEELRQQHKFVIASLTKSGMGKSEFEAKINDLVDEVELYVEKQNASSHNYYNIFVNFTFNTISSLISNVHYDLNDERYCAFRRYFMNVSLAFVNLNTLLSGNLWKFWVMTHPNMVKNIKDNYDELAKYGTELVKEREASFDEKNCKDLLDFWIKESNGYNPEYFKREYLPHVIAMFLMAGPDTTAVSLNECLYQMASHREIQQKVFEEIIHAFGSEAHFLYMDRNRVPYTQAVISEVMRVSMFSPTTFSHVNREATKIRGYHVPKGTIVIANMYKLSRSKKHFKNPFQFDPNNFLDEDGNFVSNDALIAFGVGYRKCLGAKLAEQLLFIAFVRLVRKFEWLLEDSENIPRTEISDTEIMKFSPYNLCAKLRQ